MRTRHLLFVLTLFSLFGFKADKSNPKLWKKALRIHREALTVDTHCDTPMLMIGEGFDAGTKNQAPESRVDFPRMKEGGLDAIFFGLFTAQKKRTPENYDKAYQLAIQMLDSIDSAIAKHGDLASLAMKADDAGKIEKTEKRAIYVGMENGFPLGTHIERVKEFYDRGVRYITLCHSFHNDICDSSSDKAEPEHKGVSDFGKQVIAEMNRLGIMIDVSHMSDQSFFQVMEYSKAPVIASHSSVRAVCNHNRNMSDEMIKSLAAHGGVIQICPLDIYIKEPDTTLTRYKLLDGIEKEYRSNYSSMTDAEKKELNKRWDYLQTHYLDQLPTVSDMVDHIDHIVALVGVDYVGIGSDFDGGGGLADCLDVSQFPNITYELLKRGYSEDDIRKIWGGNLFRVFKQVEQVAGELAEK